MLHYALFILPEYGSSHRVNKYEILTVLKSVNLLYWQVVLSLILSTVQSWVSYLFLKYCFNTVII